MRNNDTIVDEGKLDSQQVRGAHIILVGNEKGGSGKSTISMHVSAFLLAAGKKVGTMDLDVRQRSFTRYIENRRMIIEKLSRNIPIPNHVALDMVVGEDLGERQTLERKSFVEALGNLCADSEFIVIDTPGSDTYLSRLGHAFAHTIITPINDSFVDFDLLAKVDPDTLEIVRPNIYAEMVWECRKARAQADGTSIDWVVICNRTGHAFSRNRQHIENALAALSKRLGFRSVSGLSERVIFREMFSAGMTLLDLTKKEADISFSMAHIAARAEMYQLMRALNFPGLDVS